MALYCSVLFLHFILGVLFIVFNHLLFLSFYTWFILMPDSFIHSFIHFCVFYCVLCVRYFAMLVVISAIQINFKTHSLKIWTMKHSSNLYVASSSYLCFSSDIWVALCKKENRQLVLHFSLWHCAIIWRLSYYTLYFHLLPWTCKICTFFLTSSQMTTLEGYNFLKCCESSMLTWVYSLHCQCKLTELTFLNTVSSKLFGHRDILQSRAAILGWATRDNSNLGGR